MVGWSNEKGGENKDEGLKIIARETRPGGYWQAISTIDRLLVVAEEGFELRTVTEPASIHG